MPESFPQKKQRALEIIRILEKLYPDAKCALHFQTVFQLLVAVVLSAQCTDKQVNKITPRLFRLLPDAAAFHKASLHKIETLIHSTGFYRSKAKNIKAASGQVIKKYNGKVPQTMKELVQLPGVGRKTANVILETGYGKVEGIVVDTHVNRIIARRLRLTPRTMEGKPEKIEQELMRILPRKVWGKVGHLFVHHGRKLCIARRPKCGECPLAEMCPGKEL